MTDVTADSNEIRVLNDNFRSTFIGGHVVMTHRRERASDRRKAKALLMVKTFKDFTDGQRPAWRA